MATGLREHLELRTPFRATVRLHASNGDCRWIQASGQAQDDVSGHPIWMSGTLIDVTDLKLVEQTLRTSEARFQEIAGHIGDVLWVVNEDASRVLYVSPAYEALTGRSTESLYRDINTYLESVHPSDRKSMLNFVATLRLGRNATAEYRIVRPDGSERWVSERGFPIRDAAGAVCRITGIAVDISDRKQAETHQQVLNEGLEADAAARLRETTLLRADLERRNHEAILLNEMNGILQSCMNLDEAYNAFPHSCQRLFPRFAGSLHVLHASHHYLESVADWGDPLFTDQIFEPQSCWALRRGQCHRYDQANRGVVCQHVQPSGKRKAAYLCIPLLAQTEILGLLYLELHDSDEESTNSQHIHESELLLAASLAEHAALALANIKLRETLRVQSIRDPMTGLYNRRYFEEALLRELARAERKRIPLSIVMLDVDCFKRVNDQYGRTIGDQLLRELAGVLLAYSRISDIACRYGGEEFVLLLSDASAETAYGRAEQLRAAVSALAVQVGDGYLCRVTASIGIATCPNHANRPDALVKQADHALFLAKRSGRDRVRIAEADKVVSLTER
jgi:diguanylate cyclase (GGDEF)-like protein/PAS domain S-box-containing protein